jgi:hypothetical protein
MQDFVVLLLIIFALVRNIYPKFTFLNYYPITNKIDLSSDKRLRKEKLN